MKKSTLVAMILGTVGGVFFALGMCMALLPEWGMFNQGIACGVIGLVILLVDLLIWRRMEGKAPIHVTPKAVGTVVVGVLGYARAKRQAYGTHRHREGGRAGKPPHSPSIFTTPQTYSRRLRPPPRHFSFICARRARQEVYYGF